MKTTTKNLCHTIQIVKKELTFTFQSKLAIKLAKLILDGEWTTTLANTHTRTQKKKTYLKLENVIEKNQLAGN